MPWRKPNIGGVVINAKMIGFVIDGVRAAAMVSGARIAGLRALVVAVCAKRGSGGILWENLAGKCVFLAGFAVRLTHGTGLT